MALGKPIMKAFSLQVPEDSEKCLAYVILRCYHQRNSTERGLGTVR